MEFNSYILGLRDKAIAEALNGKQNRTGIHFKDTFIVKDLFTYDDWINIRVEDRRLLGKAFYEECLSNYPNVMMPIDRPKKPQNINIYRKEIIKWK